MTARSKSAATRIFLALQLETLLNDNLTHINNQLASLTREEQILLRWIDCADGELSLLDIHAMNNLMGKPIHTDSRVSETVWRMIVDKKIHLTPELQLMAKKPPEKNTALRAS